MELQQMSTKSLLAMHNSKAKLIARIEQIAEANSI
jgi:hypothetical protein